MGLLNTGFAVLWWAFWTIFMILGQLWSDSYPNYPEECQNLNDIIHLLVPQIEFREITDIWAGAHLLIFIIWALFFTPKGRSKERLFRIFFFLWGTIYALRGFSLVLTRYPRTNLEGNNANPEHLWWGVLGGVIGISPTMTDLMFSGHTATMVLVSEFLGYYTQHNIFSTLLWLFTLIGAFLISATQIHYTADIFIGWLIADYIFHRYHSIFDTEYLMAWRPSVKLTNIPSGIVLPATMVDADGKRFNIVRRENNKKKKRKLSQKEKAKNQLLDPYKFSSEPRQRLWKFLKKFDN